MSELFRLCAPQEEKMHKFPLSMLVVCVLMAVAALAPAAAQDAETTHIRAAHFLPDAPAVDIYVDGELAVEGLDFGQVSPWIDAPEGAYRIGVAVSGDDPEKVILTRFNAGEWTTLAAVGAPGDDLNMLRIAEDYSELESGNARVTIFHAIKGAPPVVILAEGTPPSVLVSQLGYPGSQGDNDGLFTTNVPAGEYSLQVALDDTSDAVLGNLTDTNLLSGFHYFVAAVGTAENPRIIVDATPLS
jgi:hypothetical protein